MGTQEKEENVTVIHKMANAEQVLPLNSMTRQTRWYLRCGLAQDNVHGIAQRAC